jgi:genome maintenance exonuclease 1|tara:strand:- start:15031 stop:15720 length:690 start_codon:yes stop_codon:yes gene_type:complete
MFIHSDVDFDSMSRETIDGVRYYHVPGTDKLVRLPSITSVISHRNREKFKEWRKKVGEEEANNITRKATHRGTDAHTLIEEYLNNVDPKEMSKVLPLSEYLFKQAKPTLDRIDNILCQEQALFSYQIGVAGSVDCIAEFDGELSIIDFKTSAKPKPREWIEDYFVQCAAYACMLYEMKGTTVKKFVIIMTCENGDVEVYEEYDKAKYIRLLSDYVREFVNFKLQEYAKT